MHLIKTLLGLAFVFGAASAYAGEGFGLRDDQLGCLQVDLSQQTHDALYCSGVQQKLQAFSETEALVPPPPVGERCISDRDCSFTELCVTGRCVRKGGPGGGCKFDSDCGFGKVCKFNRCEDNSGPGSRCFSNLDCAPGYRCVNRTCVR